MIAVRLNVTRHINICLEHVSGQTNAPVTNALHTPHSTFLANCLHSALLSTLTLIINELRRVDKSVFCMHYRLHAALFSALSALSAQAYIASITQVVPTGFCGIGRALNLSEQSDFRPPYARLTLCRCRKCTLPSAMSVGDSVGKISPYLHTVL